MLFSLLYMVLRGLLRLVPGGKSERERDLEILVLRHQVRVLSRNAGRPRFRRLDKAFLAAAAHALPRGRWASFTVTPQTLMRWHRELVRRKWTYRPRRLFAKAGAIGIVEFSEDGSSRFVRLKRRRIHRNLLRNGLFGWYQDYLLPPSYGGGTITVRLHGNYEDAARGLNRAENVRAIPPGDPDFYKLYARRNDSESLNRLLEDSLYIGRVHSLGHARQQVEILGWALVVNSITLARRSQRSLPLTA